jgi:hypothetical protein
MNIDTLGFVISLVLSLMVFSYLLGDNFLFRLAVSIFVGLTAAYTTIVTIQSVIYPAIQPLTDGRWTVYSLESIFFILTPLALGALLLLKPIRSLRPLSNFALAFLIAVGSAIAVVGAVSGTIIPLVTSTAQISTSSMMDILSGTVIVVGVLSSLLYFQYAARRNAQGEIKRWYGMGIVAAIGEGFIVITLGAIYGAAILTSLSILTGQLAVFLS